MIQQIKDEIVYLKENRQDRSIMHGYHQSPSPREMHKGAKSYDVQGLKKRDLDNLLTIDGDYTSKFTIGIEIEKNRFYRRIYEELNLIMKQLLIFYHYYLHLIGETKFLTCSTKQSISLKIVTHLVIINVVDI